MVQPDDALAVLGKKFRADRIKPRPLVIVERNVKTRKRRLNRFDRLQHRLQPIADCFEPTRRRCWDDRPVREATPEYWRGRRTCQAAATRCWRHLHALRLAATRPSARAYP